MDSNPTLWPAVTQMQALNDRVISAKELLDETQKTYEAVNPVINAVVAPDFERARESAVGSDKRRADGVAGAIDGLPIAIKDLEDVAGFPATYGSLVHKDHVPQHNSLMVDRLQTQGSVIYGKTNTPEFGTGSHTYNKVYGTTTNPYDPTKSAGGSSGGAAAALAVGMMSVADGSDMGGSLRNPAAFCNVVGFRPSIGLVPNWPSQDPWGTLATNGPMGRTVADVALLLSVMSGPDARAPLSGAAKLAPTTDPLERKLTVGWSESIGGLDIAPEINEVLETHGRSTIAQLGHKVIDLEPDLDGADESFRILRGLSYAQSFTRMLHEHRDLLGPELVANIEYGQRLTIQDFFNAKKLRSAMFGRLMQQFQQVDIFVGPVTAILPFDAAQNWPKEINGVHQKDYLEWMRASWRISITGCPAISVPSGFSNEGLPVGLQAFAPPGKDELLLAFAQQFEREKPFWKQRPNTVLSVATV